ncbi:MULTISPECIES: beta-class carbonic anhydrase [Lysinibacillus]|uniref:carbonic anhydrase n=1 Tax=Lysinibacillus pakistanensis TaxID=759811 RepID=A0AAX3WTH6_9BACI|nr:MULTISPECIES: carbonic anhydrase [Lysinibacillus]MDM5230430.1 carbonic anhydrase [Lysinibacillus pakistanensis]QGG53191.1 carbonic anhydrase [Lysinibacillus pakistanensis]WHY46013.1 carbonic anhydrase [Lysinibacillus pakistanensis]WHY51024.1 carbonic anhydrase [Lysinibacillus pakistanensis]
MTMLQDILKFNVDFVQEKKYEPFITTKYPDKRIVVLSCMDTRLVELLPKAMNLRNGDVKIVKSAGALVSHPFGAIMRSLLVAVYELQADEVYVVGHYDCGMSAVDPEAMLSKMVNRGISPETIKMMEYSGLDLKEFLRGFGDVATSVKKSVDTIRNHPLMVKDVPVHGLVIDPNTGRLDLIEDGSLYQG